MAGITPLPGGPFADSLVHPHLVVPLFAGDVPAGPQEPFGRGSRQPLAIASPGEDRVTIIQVAHDGRVLVYGSRVTEQEEGGTGEFLREHWGPVHLPGVRAAGTPAAVSGSPGRVDVFVRTDGDELAWTRLTGEVSTGWRILAPVVAFDPVAASFASGRVDVFVPSVGGSLRQWTCREDEPGEERGWEWGCRRPAVLAAEGGYDLYGVTPEGEVRHYLIQPDAGTSRRLRDPGDGASGDVVALRPPEGPRVDLFAPGSRGVVHWGWDGNNWFEDRPDRPPGPWLPGTIRDNEVGAEAGGYLVLASDDEQHPVVYTWLDETQHHPRGWDPFTFSGERIDHIPVGVRRTNGEDSFAYVDQGVMIHESTGHGLARWMPDRWDDEPEIEPQVRFISPDPQYVASRSDDLVLVGVQAEHLDPAPDSPGELVAGPDARLSIILPPQHIGEQTVDEGAVPVADALLRGILSGPSQVTFHVPEGTRLPLDVAGLLGALADGGLGLTPGDGTLVELPWQLALVPADGAHALEHLATPRESPDGTTALWSTRLTGTDSAPPAMRAADAGVADPFALPLPGPARQTIVHVGAADLRVDRLELTALGATLRADAHTDGFTWRHSATLGRDQQVTTQWRGVLLPFGHRAVYTEDTARRVEPGDGLTSGPATLRTTRTLTVTGPVVELDAVDFPFARVELLEHSYPGLATMGDEDWVTEPRTKDVTALMGLLARIDSDIADLQFVLTRPGPAPETLVDVDEEVRLLLAALKEKTVVGAAIRAGQLGEDVHVAFRPARSDGPVRFPVRALRPDGGVVELALPMVFVADHDLPAEHGFEAFRTLGNPRVLERVRQELAATFRADLPALALDLRPQLGVVREVHTLNFGARPTDGQFVPRLGWGGPAPDGEPDWTAEIGLPELRHLVPGPPAPARVHLPEAPVADELLRLVAPIPVDLAKDAARVGALATPSFVADAISASSGLVAAQGLVKDADGKLDPRKLLGEGARILGVDLRPLIASRLLDAAPVITHDPVTYVWTGVRLDPDAAEETGTVIQPGPGSTLAIRVEAGTGGHLTTTTLTDITLALPPQSPLFKLHFSSLEFEQSGSAPPVLRIGTVEATFQGALELLSELQKKVGLGAAGPEVRAQPDRVTAGYRIPVPEVACGVFRMSNMTFSADVAIPFNPPGVEVTLGFADRRAPFNLSVSVFGGGGYFRAVLADTGLKELAASIEFGASIAVNLGVASAEVHALGGVELVTIDGDWLFTGYLRLGGSVDLLGLISVMVELRLELAYDSTRNRMWGRATLVIELDLTLTSFDVELDSGVWEFIGGADPQRRADRAGLAADARGGFDQYHSSYALEEVGR
jgi:hypothetical protein